MFEEWNYIFLLKRLSNQTVFRETDFKRKIFHDVFGEFNIKYFKDAISDLEQSRRHTDC